jgi:hypothetical protein
MLPAATTELATLCDKELQIVKLDREVALIRNQFGSRGRLHSSVVGQSVVDAVLARYDNFLAGFEKIYLAKWRETDREFTDWDVR